MRLAYPVQWSRPSRRACEQQTMGTVAALARRGHEVTLLMPVGEGAPAPSAGELRAWFEVSGDFRVAHLRSRWAGEGVLPSGMWLRQLFAGPEVRAADLLYCRIPALLGIGSGSPVPFAVDHYRPWPDQLPVVRPLIRRTLRAPHCVGLILHSEYSARSYRRLGVDEARLLVAHNGFDPPADPPGRDEARARLGLPHDRDILVYAGRIDETKGLDRLLALADLRPEVLVVLVGSEGDGAIERDAAQRANVEVQRWAPPAELPVWLAAADVLAIPPTRAPLERFGNCVLPMKLFAYLAAGRPILAPIAPDTAELLVHDDSAWLVPPDDPTAAAAGLDRLLADAALRRRLGEAAARLAAGLTWDKRAERIAAFLERRLAAIGEGRHQRSLCSSTVRPVSTPIAGVVQAPTAAGK
jgi:glycosyltransferase involved in cell wall biosynthesis